MNSHMNSYTSIIHMNSYYSYSWTRIIHMNSYITQINSVGESEGNNGAEWLPKAHRRYPSWTNSHSRTRKELAPNRWVHWQGTPWVRLFLSRHTNRAFWGTFQGILRRFKSHFMEYFSISRNILNVSRDKTCMCEGSSWSKEFSPMSSV